MNIEHVSAPLPEPSPQMRYASLHRAVEQGMATEATWRDLVKVCVDLGLHDEARRAYREVFDPFEQKRLRSLLLRHRILSPEEAAAAPEPPPRVFVERTTFVEEAADALRFLFVDHMPLTVVVATLTFPLVVGLGGILTAGSPIFVFPAIAMLPGLTVLGIVGALGRRILLEAVEGIDDPPRIPDTGTLFGEAGRFLLDAFVLLVLLIGPAIALVLLGGPIGAIVSASALGTLLLPMALALRQLRRDWRALSPNVLFPAIVRGGVRYLGAAGMAGLLFLPAAAAGLATIGSHFYLQVSVIGPLAVGPLFISARLLGRTLKLRRNELGDLLGAPAQAQKPAPAKPAATPVSPRPRMPRNPAAVHPEARQARQAAPAAPGAPRRKAAPAAPAAPASAQAAQPQQRNPAPPQHVVGEAAPDLTKLPGVNVVTGKARQLVGAAAQTKVRSDDERDQTPPPIPVPPTLREAAPRRAPAPVTRPPLRRRN